MKNILFLTAYAGHAPFVFRYALTLARHFGAGVTLLHVYEGVSPELVTTGAMLDAGAGNLRRFSQMLREQETEKLKTFARQHTPPDLHGVPLHYEVRTGSPGEEVLALQKAYASGLVVMGAKIRNTIGEALFGSMARFMIDRAPCPVLLVPPMAQYVGITKIVYASNFSYRDESVIRHLLDWSEAFAAELHVVHVVTAEKERRDAQASLDNLARNFQASERLHFELVAGNIAPRLDEYGDRIGADLIAATTQKRDFWDQLLGRSVTRGIAKEVEIPILVFKE